MNAIVPFTFDHREVRAVERDGQPWFVAADVCAALGISNSRDAVARLDPDEKGVASTDTLGGRQDLAVISEGGLYALALRCRDAMTPGAPAYRFRKWVTGEVLPALRRSGHYGRAADPLAALNDPATMRGLLLGYSEKVLALESRNAELEPQAAALDRIATATGSMNITAAAKALQMRPSDLQRWLRTNGWTYRRPGSDRLLGYSSKVDTGCLEHKMTTVERPGEPARVYEQVMVTPKGLTRLAALLGARRAA